MEERILIFSILLLTNEIHGWLVEDTCTTHEIKSNGVTVCADPPPRTFYNEYESPDGNVDDLESPRCQTTYQVIGKIITCSNVSITNGVSIDQVDHEGTTPITLKIADSNVEILPTSIFKNFKKLTILYLQNSNLKTITPGAFNFLDDLKELYLSGNRLTTISHGLFNSLTLLKTLDLSKNQIQDISDHAFHGTKLVELRLSHNNLSQMSQPLLQSLTDLKILHLSWNNISNITSFNNMPLTTLNLSHNTIDVVDFEFLVHTDSKLFQETTEIYWDRYSENSNKILIELDLSFNFINEIINFNASEASEILLNHNRLRHFDANINTEILDLSYNELESIGSEIKSAALKRFNAGNNLISHIEPGAFFGLHLLEYLLLNNNNLSSLPNSCFKDLRNLIHLDLSRNELTSFTFGTFDNLKSLQVLDISYNNLKHLHQDTFHALTNLTDFSFQNNEISDVDMNDLKRHMPHLARVNLDGNVWSCNRLVDIVHELKTMQVTLSDGNYLQENNVFGIKCYKIVDRTVVAQGSTSAIDAGYKRLNSFFNEDFTKTIMYKYFNEDFKDSNFFKYLESLMNNTSRLNENNFNATYFVALLKGMQFNSSDVYDKKFEQGEMFNYFNKDFKNSTFFRYLESFKSKAAIENNAEKIIDRRLEEAVRSFKEALEKNSNKSLNFNDSDLYKNFTENLKSFFKHMEGLSERTLPNNFDSLNESKAEKVVREPEVEKTTPNNSGLLAFILIFLIINTGVITVKTYLAIFRKKKYDHPRKEEVELI